MGEPDSQSEYARNIVHLHDISHNLVERGIRAAGRHATPVFQTELVAQPQGSAAGHQQFTSNIAPKRPITAKSALSSAIRNGLLLA